MIHVIQLIGLCEQNYHEVLKPNLQGWCSIQLTVSVAIHKTGKQQQIKKMKIAHLQVQIFLSFLVQNIWPEPCMVRWIPNHENTDLTGILGLKAGIVDGKEPIHFVIIWVASDKFCELTVRNTNTYPEELFLSGVEEQVGKM
jgi:hypothetical protein